MTDVPHKILIVDDDSATRRMVCRALQRNGHDVFEAPDGKTAREVMRRERPRVVLQDLMLPDTDGFELVGQLRRLAEGADVSILAFSGFVSELDSSRVSSVGFDDVIAKPIAPSRLVPIIEAHLRVPVSNGNRLGARPLATRSPPAPLSARPIPVPSVRRGKILVIDDEESLALAIKRFLTVDHDVTAVLSANTALELFEGGTRYDVILCDLMMPQITGMDLYDLVERLAPDQAVKMVFVTGGAFTTAAREFLATTVNRRLEKPFDLKELRKLITELVG